MLELTGLSLQAALMPRRLYSLFGTWESRSLNSRLRKYWRGEDSAGGSVLLLKGLERNVGTWNPSPLSTLYILSRDFSSSLFAYYSSFWFFSINWHLKGCNALWRITVRMSYLPDLLWGSACTWAVLHPCLIVLLPWACCFGKGLCSCSLETLSALCMWH